MFKSIFLLLISCAISSLYGGGSDSLRRVHQISVVGGLMHDSYNSGGFRLLVQYQHRIKSTRHWLWGIGYDTKLALYRPAIDIYDPPELTTQNFSATLHYQRFIWKNRIGWDAGAGPALVHAMEAQRYGTRNLALWGFRFSANLNIRITRSISFQTAPLLFIPFASDAYVLSRQAYSRPTRSYQTYLQYSVLPLGFRFEQ